jgi:hypothetical protein
MRDERPMSGAAIEALAQGRHGDPFALLGPQREGEQWVVRALLPGARAVTALGPSGETLAAFRRVHEARLFEAEISERPDYRPLHDPGRHDSGDGGPVFLSAAVRGARCLPARRSSLDNAEFHHLALQQARAPARVSLRRFGSRPERSGVPPNRSLESERRHPLPTDAGFSTGSSDARYREAG